MNGAALDLFRPRLTQRRRLGRVFHGFCLGVSVGAVCILVTLLWGVFRDGWSLVNLEFLRRLPSMLFPETAGVSAPLVGTVWLLFLTSLIAVPVGIGAAIYLQEFAPRSRLFELIHLNISNLAGVPSIVYGLLGVAVFVRMLGAGRSVLAASLTLSLLILPVIIIATREALMAVPQSIRHAAAALGATPWQTVWHHVLPAATPGIMTGLILAVSRAIGETAPLIVIGAGFYMTAVPGGNLEEYPRTAAGMWHWLHDAALGPYTALPLQIYFWASSPQADLRALASAAIIVLLTVLLSFNAIAAGIRVWQQKHRAW